MDAPLGKPLSAPRPTRPARKATPPRPKEDRHFVTALSRGLEVLSCFRSSDRALGNQDIAERCRLPKSTVSRLTSTLTRLGYLVQQDEGGKYRLGNATLALGSTMLARMDVRPLARPLMQELADLSRAMVSLGTRDRLSMIYVENCRSSAALTLSLDIGSRIPLATTSMGRAYLAAVGERERQQVLERLQPQVDADTHADITRGLAQAVDDYRTLGVTTCFGEWQRDVNAIARPFHPGGGRPPMAINCGGPSYTLSKDFLLAEVRPRLIELAQRLESLLTR